MKNKTRITFAPAVDDDKRTEARGEELRSIQMMALWHTVLLHYQKDLEKRLKGIPQGWRQYRMIAACVEKLLMQLYDTLPNSTMSRIVLNSRAVEMRLMPKSATSKEYFVLSFEDFLELLKYVDDGACRMCLGDEQTARKCPLRRILRDQVPPIGDSASHHFAACPYSDGVLSIAVRKATGQ